MEDCEALGAKVIAGLPEHCSMEQKSHAFLENMLLCYGTLWIMEEEPPLERFAHLVEATFSNANQPTGGEHVDTC